MCLQVLRQLGIEKRINTVTCGRNSACGRWLVKRRYNLGCDCKNRTAFALGIILKFVVSSMYTEVHRSQVHINIKSHAVHPCYWSRNVIFWNRQIALIHSMMNIFLKGLLFISIINDFCGICYINVNSFSFWHVLITFNYFKTAGWYVTCQELIDLLWWIQSIKAEEFSVYCLHHGKDYVPYP